MCCHVQYCSGRTDALQTLSTLRALLNVRRLAVSLIPKQREDETAVFGGWCSERAEEFEIRASTVVFVREPAERLGGAYSA